MLFVVSCTEQSDAPPHQAKQPEVQHNSPTRTPQEAQNEVADFLAAMGKKTRSATRPTIANVETLRSRQFATRAAVDSLSIDTLLYFVRQSRLRRRRRRQAYQPHPRFDRQRKL